MSHCEIAFFEFKADRLGNLRFGGVNVLSETLEDIAAFSNMGYRLLKEFDAKFIYELLDGKIWIGHDIGSDVPRLVKAFAEIGIDHPTPKSIFDTRILLLSDTKFAKLAVHLGLGKEGRNSYDDLLQNINAIKHCEGVLSLCLSSQISTLYEPDKMEKYVGRDFHPVISYLMDLPTADVTEDFPELRGLGDGEIAPSLKWRRRKEETRRRWAETNGIEPTSDLISM